MEMPVPTATSPAALQELLAAVPSAHPPTTGSEGSTRVGSETGEKPGASAAASAPGRTKRGRLKAGEMSLQPLLSSPAIERAAREQIYWPLAQKCKGPDGKPPPPDSILLKFTIRGDGTVHPASVEASSEDPRLEATAECVLREFSALPFRGPPAGRQSDARVIMTWPSVD
jgi:outer membrane biosynthesis protein TonB